MTIASSGPLRTWGGVGATLDWNGVGLMNEYGEDATEPYLYLLSHYYRGASTGFVKKNAANNNAVNHSAAVPEAGVPLRMSHFYGQGTGWTYTNTTERARSGGAHYYPDDEFGDDWLANPWPMFYINNATIGATWSDTYAVVLWGRDAGPFTFTNNSEIQGASGVPNSGGGQHAFYIQHTVAAFKPRIINNGGIRGGGGAGGIGGTGGAGGQGYYVATGQEGPAYSIQGYEIYVYPGGAHGQVKVWWASGLQYQNYAPPYSAITIGAYTYHQGARRSGTAPDYNHYEVYRQWPYNVVTGGGGGGGGGNGGYGQGYGRANTGGNGGAPGAGGGANAGAGGYGGTGGTGGTWGQYGGTGATGAGGGYGNYSGWGGGGYGGGGGGAPGYAIYAEANTPWSWVNNNYTTDWIGGGTAPS